MTNTERPSATLEDLQTALDTFGADRTRWPAPLRHSLAHIIASNGDAGRMVREAEAFDRLMDMAPVVNPAAITRLADKIGDAASRQPRLAATSAVAASAGSASRAARPTVGRRDHAWAAAALAASLVFGIVVGQSPVVDPAAAILIGAEGDTSARQVANIDDVEGILDEELL